MNQEDFEYLMENEEECDEFLCGLSINDIVDIEINLRRD